MGKSKVAFAVFGALAAMAVATAVASAPFDHANPGPEQVVVAPPAHIDFYTGAPTSPRAADTQIIVTGPDGKSADTNDSAVDPADHRHIIVGLRPGLPGGRYIVSFKTRGETDQEYDGGAYAFYVGGAPSPAELKADKALHLTVGNDFGESVSGYQRGFIEGGLTLLIALPVGIYYLRRRLKRDKEASPLDSL